MAGHYNWLNHRSRRVAKGQPMVSPGRAFRSKIFAQLYSMNTQPRYGRRTARCTMWGSPLPLIKTQSGEPEVDACRAGARRAPCSVLAPVSHPRPCDEPKGLITQRLRLRIGSVNVGTMAGRSVEVAEMAGRRRLDFCCVQETRWKGGSARMLGGEGFRYKFYWMGCEEGVSGVGVLVAERWIENVIEVRRVNERIIVVRLMIANGIVNLISVYAPQVGRSMEDKEEFYALLGKTLTNLDADEKLLILGDFNGHVGERVDGFEGVHGDKGFGNRNLEGEMILEFADSRELIIANTFFQKEAAKLVTYESGGSKTVVDYMMVRKSDRGIVRDVKAIPREECIQQHKLLIGVIELREQAKKKRKIFVSKCRVWKLKQQDIRNRFHNRIQNCSEGRSVDGDIEVVWKELRDCMLGAADDICGRTKGPVRHKETWWWNSDTNEAVREKRTKFLTWRKTGNATDRIAYTLAKKKARNVIAKAQNEEG